MTNQRPDENLWRDYLFLTREMLKFAGQANLDMFYELLDQRQAIQEQIDAVTAGNKENRRDDPEWQAMVDEIQNSNRQIVGRLRLAQNQLKQQKTRANAYEGITPEVLRGYRGDWRT